MAKSVTVPSLTVLGSYLITAAIPLGAYALVNKFLYPELNLFILPALDALSGFIVGAGAAAFAHRSAKRR